MKPADSSMTGYWPDMPHRCPTCGAVEYARMEETPNANASEYDSTKDTLEHIERVRQYLFKVQCDLLLRGAAHDASKLKSPEKEVYDHLTPLKRKTTYGSPEYQRIMAEMGDIPKYHYEQNRHHPEHFVDGINDMSLVDIVEMLCDWKAASEEYAAGDLAKSIEINVRRFCISEQLAAILRNTARDFGWIAEQSE